MGHRKKLTIYTIDLSEKYDELEVRMGSLRLGKMRRVLSALNSGDDDSLSDEGLDQLITLIADSLVSWTLEDEKGNPLEPSRDEVEDLELEMLMAIVNGWLAEVMGVPDDLGKDSPSGEQFPGKPVTMEAL